LRKREYRWSLQHCTVLQPTEFPCKPQAELHLAGHQAGIAECFLL
jgi:hypothetical protein